MKFLLVIWLQISTGIFWNCRSEMNDFFCPLLEKFCPLLKYFQIFCPVGVQIPQTVVHFAQFQVQARKRGVFGWAWRCLVYVHIPEWGVWLSKEQGLGWYSGQNETRFEAMYKPNVSLLQWRKWIPVCVLWWKKIHGGMLIPRRNWSEEHR